MGALNQLGLLGKAPCLTAMKKCHLPPCRQGKPWSSLLLQAVHFLSKVKPSALLLQGTALCAVAQGYCFLPQIAASAFLALVICCSSRSRVALVVVFLSMVSISSTTARYPGVLWNTRMARSPQDTR